MDKYSKTDAAVSSLTPEQYLLLQPTRIIQRKGIEHAIELTRRLRSLRDRGLAEVPSTRLLIAAGLLAVRGIDLRRACWHAVVAPLSDEPSLVAAMRDLVDATFV